MRHTSHLESELHELALDHYESGQLPSIHNLVRVYQVPSSLKHATRTAAERLASDELVSVFTPVEAGRARQRLEHLLERCLGTDFGPGQVELILRAEFATFLEHAMRTWCRLTYQLGRAEDRDVTTVEIVELCLFAGWFYLEVVNRPVHCSAVGG